MPSPVSRADFARIAGVSDVAVSKWAKGAGSAACIGKRIDRDHPVARAYLLSKGVKVARPSAFNPPMLATPPPEPKIAPARPVAERGTRARAPEPAPKIEPIDLEKSFDELADLTLRDFVSRYGSSQGAKDWLDALKKIVDIHEKDLKNAETEGRLIERDLVRVHVFGAIEASHRRLLADASKTIVVSLYPMARRGDSIDDGEKVVKDIIGKILEQVKSTADRVIGKG
jgi:hypothetical protein